MDRLISTDALLREVETLISNNKQLIDEWFANVITDAIDDAPTVDAVEVVRCRDCKQFVQTNAIHDGECPKLQLFVNRDYYCWWGERKEDTDD